MRKVDTTLIAKIAMLPAVLLTGVCLAQNNYVTFELDRENNWELLIT